MTFVIVLSYEKAVSLVQLKKVKTTKTRVAPITRIKMKTKKQDQKVAQICTKYAKVETALQHCNQDPEMIEAIYKHYNRAILSAKFPDKTVKKQMDDRIIERLDEIARNLPDDGYSMGSMYYVHCKRLTGQYSRCSEYAKSSHFSAKHSRVDLKITSDEYRNISIIGGLVTYIYPNQRNKVKKCWWYVGRGQKQHFELIKIEGYVYAGYHSTDKAKTLAGGLQNIELQKQAKKRAELDLKQKQIWQKKVAQATRMQYCYQDSRDAGNCETGTKAFILRCQLNANKRYRGSFLLKIAAEKSTSSLSYVKKMIEHKASKII